MKRSAVIAVCLSFLLLFCSCRLEGQNDVLFTKKGVKKTEPATVTEPAIGETVTFLNGVAQTDVWLLPQTEENLKTSLWGTPTASGVKTGESRPVSLCRPGDDGHYLLRMIDVDKFCYYANDLTLQSGWSLRIEEVEPMHVTLEITDGNGVLINTCDVFCARL